MTEQSLQPNLDLPDEWDLISGFVDDCVLRGYSPETIRSHRSNLRTIARFLDTEKMGFRDVDKNVLKSILTYLRARAHLRDGLAPTRYITKVVAGSSESQTLLSSSRSIQFR